MKTLVASLLFFTFLLPYSLMAQYDTTRSVPTQNDTATYRVTFESTWNNETHPHQNFPSNAHFSSLIGAVHNAQTTFWQTGDFATPGIESMAETGGTSILRSEVQEEIGRNNALAVLSGSGMIDSFEVSQMFPLVTLVTMIAPSPDWFIGVSNLSLLDEQGQWRERHTVTLYPYDSGTDSGVDYTSPNANTNPPELISRIRGEFPFSNEPIGTFTFTRIDEPEPKWNIYLPLSAH